jgi:putative PIN family toxin of toxin-antitoxin system
MERQKTRVVIDTNVVISAMRSTKGASYKLLFRTSRKKFEQVISALLIFEYESTAKKQIKELRVKEKQLERIIDEICNISLKQKVFFLWRPFLRDTKDDFVLELAIASSSKYILTYNLNDFAGVEKFGIQVITPKEFLQKIGEIKHERS